MTNIPSRREKREQKIYLASESGKYTIQCKLFKSEAKSLISEGFYVAFNDELNDITKKVSNPATISWENPFKKGIPPIVTNYIIGTIETFPKNLTWAQELYVIAARANYKKGTN